MDLSFPGKRSHFLSVCLSPALLLNQGEWSYLLALLERGALEGASGRVRAPSCSSRSGVRQVEGEIKAALELALELVRPVEFGVTDWGS